MYGSSGSIWQWRYKASLVQGEGYLLTCMRYIELNPVRANMVRIPTGYRWSSYQFNGSGKVDVLLTAHPVYLGLSPNEKIRRSAYRELLGTNLDEGALNEIRSAWKTGTPYGNDIFREKVE